jgi:hypothetical protein
MTRDVPAMAAMPAAWGATRQRSRSGGSIRHAAGAGTAGTRGFAAGAEHSQASRAAVTTPVAVVPSAAARAATADHISSLIRTCRAGVTAT